MQSGAHSDSSSPHNSSPHNRFQIERHNDNLRGSVDTSVAQSTQDVEAIEIARTKLQQLRSDLELARSPRTSKRFVTEAAARRYAARLGQSKADDDVLVEESIRLARSIFASQLT